VGRFEPSAGAVESELDVQTLGGMASGATNWYWTTSDWMYGWTEDLVSESTSNLPFIFSISYGWSEVRQCQIAPTAKPCEAGGTSEDFVSQTNSNFKAVGARGVSFVVATGDSGCHGRTDPFCLSQKMNPDYPTGSPYVTAVGATQLVDAVITGATSNICTNSSATAPYENTVMGKCGVSGREIVSSTETGSLITSGGGFSAYASRSSEASYQDSVVSTYLSNTSAIPAQSDFNSAGRGYPDVAALGHNYLVSIGGRAGAVDGTSAACPAFAGVLGLVTSKLGAKRLGFANPLIYQTYGKDKSSFTDVTQGRNWSTENNRNCPDGYNAAEGWDATTGLGVINYVKFTAAAEALINEGASKRNLRH
jgi:tripeptidyl-peptidase-1